MRNKTDISKGVMMKRFCVNRAKIDIIPKKTSTGIRDFGNFCGGGNILFFISPTFFS
jgi:hypothetical protein